MKRLLIIAFFCAATVYAQAPVGKDVEGILDRAADLQARGNKIIHEFNNHNKTHLLSALEYEVSQLEATVKQFKSLEQNVSASRTPELNKLEENLLHFENRIEEEMDFVNEVYNLNGTGKTANELVAYGTELVKMARDEVAKHADHGHLEVLTIQSEIRSIEALVKEIQANPTARRLEQDEVALVRVEMSLRALLARIAHSS